MKQLIDKQAFGRRLAKARELAGLTQAQLGDRTGYTQQSIQGIEDGKVARPGKINEIAEAVGSTVKWLLYEEGEERTPSRGDSLTTATKAPRAAEPNQPNLRQGGPIDGFVRVPVRGQGMGGKDGALIFNGDSNMGDILAPPVLFNVPGAYAVYVVGDSMDPKFSEGEVCYIHPFLPVRKNDYCVIQISMGEGVQPQGWIKRFVSRDAKMLKASQFNPKKVLSWPVSRVISVHKIIMSGPV